MALVANENTCSCVRSHLPSRTQTLDTPHSDTQMTECFGAGAPAGSLLWACAPGISDPTNSDPLSSHRTPSLHSTATIDHSNQSVRLLPSTCLDFKLDVLRKAFVQHVRHLGIAARTSCRPRNTPGIVCGATTAAAGPGPSRWLVDTCTGVLDSTVRCEPLAD